MSLTSSDLELIDDGGPQTVGLRFPGLTIPQDATIVDAWVQFQVDEATTAATTLTIAAEAADSALPFTTATGSLSARLPTDARVPWAPAGWPTMGAAGLAQRAQVLAPVVQDVVSRQGWRAGNALVLLITGAGKRVAESYDGSRTGAPLLHVEWQ